MKLSIIIPVYNGDKYLDNCLKSIVNQEYRNLQIICIDDGSTDNSLNILQEWKKKDSRIEVYSKTNSGVSSARNTGMHYVKGQFITFVDCDDTLEVDMYKKLMPEFKNQNVDIVHCTYNRIPYNGHKYTVGGKGTKDVQSGTNLCALLISGKQITGSTWTKIYRRRIINDLIFDITLKINEDVLFNYFAMKRASKTVFLDLGLYNYYERKFSACQSTDKLKIVNDCTKVSKIIYENEDDYKLKQLARNKYYLCLCNQLREYIFSGISTIECKKQIEDLLKEGISVRKKYLYNYFLLKRLPKVYKNLYKIYDLIRKPNLDV